jgi:hypothetical protein
VAGIQAAFEALIVGSFLKALRMPTAIPMSDVDAIDDPPHDHQEGRTVRRRLSG